MSAPEETDTFDEAADEHSGAAQYAVLWDQNPVATPSAGNAQSLDSGVRPTADTVSRSPTQRELCELDVRDRSRVERTYCRQIPGLETAPMSLSCAQRFSQRSRQCRARYSSRARLAFAARIKSGVGAAGLTNTILSPGRARPSFILKPFTTSWSDKSGYGPPMK